MSRIRDKLIEKSKEAFMMAIEIYNKPTIRYRIEGFSFFICNAWELMLKAHIINKFGDEEIYYKDNPDRTISLEKCIEKVFTNKKAPLRLNLEKIIELRNTSTHFITEEYEMVYVPLFQSCVFNFNEKMLEFHEIDMTEYLPQNFLTLSVSLSSITDAEIRAKYPEQIAERLIKTSSRLVQMTEENNNAFAIRVEHHYFITKDKNKASSSVRIDSSAETPARIIKELKDPNDTHKYTTKKCIEEIKKRLKKLGVSIDFNKYHFGLFVLYYDIKSIDKFCYTYKVGSNPNYSYSIHTIEFIIDEIKKDPDNIYRTLKEQLKKRQKK